MLRTTKSNSRNYIVTLFVFSFHMVSLSMENFPMHLLHFSYVLVLVPVDVFPTEIFHNLPSITPNGFIQEPFLQTFSTRVEISILKLVTAPIYVLRA